MGFFAFVFPEGHYCCPSALLYSDTAKSKGISDSYYPSVFVSEATVGQVLDDFFADGKWDSYEQNGVTYDHLIELNPYSLDDLLAAHHIMMQNLVQEAGEFRSCPVGVADSKGNVLHFGTLPQDIPIQMEELFQWTETSRSRF